MKKTPRAAAILLGLWLTAAPLTALQTAWAAPPPQHIQSSIGLQGTIPSAPPSRSATITIPGNGAIFTGTPITVSGICPAGLLIKIFDNNVFVGSAVCSSGGSYTLQIDLFTGRNDLIARDYDSLDQNGPDSSTVTVTLNDAQFLQFGTHVSLSSVYAERGAPPGSELDWPVILNGGTGPYAISVDWGDGSPADLYSQSFAGSITLKHTYKSAGLYVVIVKATDKNGEEAFLQLVGQATGAIQSNSHAASSSGNLIVQKTVLWWPALAMFPLIIAAYWLGGRQKLFQLRKRMQ